MGTFYTVPMFTYLCSCLVNNQVDKNSFSRKFNISYQVTSTTFVERSYFSSWRVIIKYSLNSVVLRLTSCVSIITFKLKFRVSSLQHPTYYLSLPICYNSTSELHPMLPFTHLNKWVV